MSDTPKVDAFLRAENCTRGNPVAFDWLVGFARSLERELAEAEKIGNALARELGEARQLSRDAYEEVARLRGFDKP